jgi:putative ATP-binding cassette transporter
MIELFGFLFREIRLSKTPIVVLSFLSGLSRGMLIALINAAAAAIGTGDPLFFAVPFAIVLGIYIIAAYYARIQSQSLIEDMTARLRLRFCDKLLGVRASHLIGRDTGDIYNTMTQEVSRVSGTSIQLLDNLQAAVLLVFCVPYLLWLSPIGAMATFLAVLLGVAVYFVQDRRASDMIEESRRLEGTFFDRVNDVLEGFKELRLNRRRTADLQTDIKTRVQKTKTLSIDAERKFSRSVMTSQGVIFALLAFLVMGLPALSGSGHTTVFQFLTVILFALSPLEVLIGHYPAMMRAQVSLQRMLAMERDFDAALETHDSSADQSDFRNFRSITVKQLKVQLKDPELIDDEGRDIASEAFVLGPLDLEIRRGEILFISGSNGTGKTTLLSLLSGLREPDSGDIHVDGVPVTGDMLPAYRDLFAGVFSDFHLFQQLYGLSDDDHPVLDGLLREFDLRQRTKVVDGGFSSLVLSTGQRRRLALCVALMDDRPVLLFDEFAADQDPQHRRFFYEALLPRLRAEGKTVIAVTHDEARFSDCDRLIELDTGRIATVRLGNYDKLSKA